MRLIHREDYIPVQELVTLRDVINHIGHRDHGQGHLRLIALTRQMSQVNQRHVRFRPQLSFAVEQLRFKAAGLRKHAQGFRHFRRFRLALGIADIDGTLIVVRCNVIQRLLQVRRQHLPPFLIRGMRGHQQRLTYHRPVCTLKVSLFFRVAAGDHHARGDFHFTENVTLVILAIVVRVDIRQVALIHGLGSQAFFHQFVSISKWRQTDAASGFNTDFIHCQPEAVKEVGQQAERVPGLRNKQPRTVDGHKLGERGTQRGRLARPGRAEQQQMRVLGAVELIERIECQGIPAAVEKTEARMPRAGFPPGYRQKTGQVLNPGQTGIPVFFVTVRVKTHRQCPQPAVQWTFFKLRTYRLQTGTQQYGGQRQSLALQADHIIAAQQEGDPRPVQLVPVAQILFYRLHILANTARLGILTDRIFRQPVKLLFKPVLRLHHYGHTHHGPFRKHIHQGINFLFTPAFLAGKGTWLRRCAQLFHRHRTVWFVVNPPHAVFRV